jgi:AhpD family alkylhydroperoxidase
MTTTTQIPQRLDFDEHAAIFAKALAHLDNAATRELDRVGFDSGLRDLLRLRASQLNGCAYCVDAHAKDARAGGESEERLTMLPVWREAPFYTARERAALAFTETVVLMAQTHVPAEAYEAVAAEFSPGEIAALVSLIVAISAWNAVGVSTRTWEPGSYQP